MKRRSFLGGLITAVIAFFVPARRVFGAPQDTIRHFRDGTVINYSLEYRKYLQNECYRLGLPILRHWEESRTAEQAKTALRDIRAALSDRRLLSPSTDDVIAWLIRENRPFTERHLRT